MAWPDVKAIMGPMDTTPIREQVSDLADLDPAEAVDAAESLADDLEGSLAEPVPRGEQPDAPAT
jgi:hypothetical protein